MMAVDVKESSSTFEPGTPRVMFTLPEGCADFDRFDYDVSSDGQRFLLNVPSGKARAASLNLIYNWPALLNK